MSETRIECDVVVVGVGGMGAAAMAHLARRGLRVVGVEQHDVPHALGSSHGRARVIRKVYFEDPRYVPLLERSYELWRELERASGQTLMNLVGCVNLGRAEHPLMRAVLESARAHSLPHELLSAREVCARFPAFTLDDDVVGVYEADAGVVSVEKCTRAHADIALAHGATLLTHQRVLDVDTGATIDGAGRSAVRVTMANTRIDASAVVFAGGPWSPALPGLGTSSSASAPTAALWAQRQVQTWYAPVDERFALGRFPAFIHFLDDDLPEMHDKGSRPTTAATTATTATASRVGPMKTAGGRGAGDPGRAYYGMPPWEGGGVKIARHGGGARVNADDVDRGVHAADVDDVRSYLRMCLPDLDAAPIETEVCMYTMSPDGHFVVGKIAENAVLVGGFSGHGYKMASVMGEIAADLVVDGKTRHDIAFFDPRRFS